MREQLQDAKELQTPKYLNRTPTIWSAKMREFIVSFA